MEGRHLMVLRRPSSSALITHLAVGSAKPKVLQRRDFSRASSRCPAGLLSSSFSAARARIARSRGVTAGCVTPSTPRTWRRSSIQEVCSQGMEDKQSSSW